MSYSFFIPENFKNQIGELTEFLKSMCTQNRYEKFLNVLSNRSKNVITVFENTHHAHNISAIIRSVDSFGFMNILFLYSLENMKFRASDSIDRGSSQWLFIQHKNKISETADYLKNSGYKIACVTLPDFSRTSQNYLHHIPAFSTNELNSKKFTECLKESKIALIFGSELIGISEEWKNYVDLYIYVDMYGFSESLNVSVCAALILQSLRNFFEKNNCLLKYTEIEKKIIMDYWMSRDYLHSETLIQNKKKELFDYYLFVKKGLFFLK